ncbi:uncharacterized protein PAC_18509 [Phialocephala subalpina]|uniref:Uncharacterized protein n=1 Tax=Phialocephala subalpina TaxID=576137 RepID=A0A1L7XUB0_9HELO|nr:uncharacterized protein PAC_18509 [Phialocephala subalpina]
MVKLYYFQAPSLSINPDSAIAPKLGSIFSTLETLTAPLNQDEYVTVPSNLINKSANADFNEAVKQKLEAKADLNVNVAQGIASSADLVYAFARDKKNVYHCELLETLEFAPTKEYVTECILASLRVQAFLENSLVGRKRVFMITGLKIASRFTTSSTNETRHHPKLKVAANGTVVGFPGEAGLELDVTVANSRTVDLGRTVNRIVFAYRVIRVKLKRDGEARYRYKSGGKYTADEESDEDEEEEGRYDLEPLDEEDRLKDFPDSVRVELEGESSPGDGN